MKFATTVESLPNDSKPLVLVSGGFDSVGCVLAVENAGLRFSLVTIDYDDRPKSEIAAFDKICEVRGWHVNRVHLGNVKDNRTLAPEERGTRNEAWFPYRNLLFLGIAANKCVELGCDAIVIGTRIWDTDAYADASRPYFEDLCRLIGSSTSNAVDGPRMLVAPHIEGHRFAQEYYERHPGELDRTWSCWRSGAEPCGDCAPCRTRTKFLEDIQS